MEQKNTAEVLHTQIGFIKVQQKSTLPLQPATNKFENALCSFFFLQGNCKKGTCCNFVHDKIGIGEVVKWQDHHNNNEVIPLKVYSKGMIMQDGRLTFMIGANLIGPRNFCEVFISEFPNRFRKKANTY